MPTSLQHDDVNLIYFKLFLSLSLSYWFPKIQGLENQSLWQKLIYFEKKLPFKRTRGLVQTASPKPGHFFFIKFKFVYMLRWFNRIINLINEWKRINFSKYKKKYKSFIKKDRNKNSLIIFFREHSIFFFILKKK